MRPVVTCGVQKIGKKGAKKKVGDFMLKKEWYDVKPPTYFGKVCAQLGLMQVLTVGSARLSRRW